MRHVPLIVLALLASACSRPPEKASVPAPATIGARCVDCHADLTHSDRATGMAQAVGPLRPGELARLPAVADTNSGWSYQFQEDGSGARLVENWKGTRVRDVEISFAIGAGLMDRSYVARVGELQWFAPLEVVNTKSVRVPALAPGHSIRPGTRFTTPITEECLACHTDRLPPRDYPLNLRPAPGTWRPEGISCGACHGTSTLTPRIWRPAPAAQISLSPIVPIRSQASRCVRAATCRATQAFRSSRARVASSRPVATCSNVAPYTSPPSRRMRLDS